MAVIRIVLADDHAILRDGLRGLLERDPALIVVGEAEDGAGALRQVADLAPDVLILDMELPDMDGVEVSRRLRAVGSPVRVLGLSAHDDTEHIAGLLAAGAAGYLLKSEAREAIIDAVHGTARGEVGWLSHRAAARLLAHASAFPAATSTAATTLSEREREVLRLLARGRDNTQIATALGIATATVRKHVETIFGKLGVHKRSEAVAWAWEHGICAAPQLGEG